MKRYFLFFVGSVVLMIVLLGFLYSPRSGLAAFHDNGDGTVSDSETGLMWEQYCADERGRNWQGAIEYCNDLKLPEGVHTDWRLPKITELESLVDSSKYPVVDQLFTCALTHYWSITEVVDFPEHAYQIHLYDGSVAYTHKDGILYVRCVRKDTPEECSFEIDPSSKNFSSSGGTQSVSVDASSSTCSWTVSESLSWVSVSKTGGTGNGSVRITVDANTEPSSKSGNVTIAGKTFNVTQDGAPASCSYNFSPTALENFTSDGGTQSVSVYASSSTCSWTVSESLSWVEVSKTNGIGNDSVTVKVYPNTKYSSNSGNITIAGKTFAVTQDGQAQVTMPIGTILYRTSGGNEMPGRVTLPTGGSLNFPYLQVPCAIYCGLAPFPPTCTNDPYPPTRTGHVAIYIGEEYGVQKIIEAGGNIWPLGIEIVDLNTFVDESKGQVFIGAKFPSGKDVHGRSLPNNWQENLKTLALKEKGTYYDFDFQQQKGPSVREWICVGFAEKMYESCNRQDFPVYSKPYPYGGGLYGGYDITEDGFHNNGDLGGLTNSYSYEGSDSYSNETSEGYFRKCGEICKADVFPAYATYSNSKEFSEMKHPRNDADEFFCGSQGIVGRENSGRFYIFWPYTQFKQDTLKSIRTTLDIGTTVVNVVGGPSKANPVTVFPGCGKTIEIEVEVMQRNGSKIESSDLKASNFVISLEKNEDGRCVAIPSEYNKTTREVYFYSSNIPYSMMGCGTYEIRVDYKDAAGAVRSSYSRDNALIISSIGSNAKILNKTFLSGTTSDYAASKFLSVGPGVTVENGGKVTISAPTVKLTSDRSGIRGTGSIGFHAKRGSYVHIKAEYPNYYTNSLGQNFVRLPAGTFTMGSPPDEPGRHENEGPQHQVTLTRSFHMQTTEVTQTQWEAVMGNNPASFSGCPDCPVESVTWSDVQNFILKMNARGDGNYRLPTEAEWEYACRAGSTTAFYNGGITETGMGYDPNLDTIGWYSYNSHNETHPVGKKAPNAWGLYDMSGNVWEWCSDSFSGYSPEPVTDPEGPTEPPRSFEQVIRGGSWVWVYPASICRSAWRSTTDSIGNRGTGFRLVLSSDQK